LKEAEKFGIDGIDQKQVSFNWENAKKRGEKIVKKLTGGVEYLLKKNGVDIIIGEAKINKDKSITVNNSNLEASNILIATGSYPRQTAHNIPMEKVISIDKLFDLEVLPEKIVLFGHGPHIAEMAQFFNFVEKDVTIVLNHERIVHDSDVFLSDFIYKKLKSQGIKIIHAETIDYKDNKLIGGDQMIDFDIFINLDLRTAILPPSELPIQLNENGFIQTDENLKTSIENVFAIGDVNGKSYLAHAASAQGIWVINHIKGIKFDLNLKNYPLNIYTSPEMAQIGLDEESIKEQGIDYKINEFPLSANGKALTEGHTEGLVRMISDKKYGQVLGVQIIAEHATDMIAEASAWMQIEGTVYDIAQTIHAHPTVSEIFMEAGFDAVDQAIHK